MMGNTLSRHPLKTPTKSDAMDETVTEEVRAAHQAGPDISETDSQERSPKSSHGNDTDDQNDDPNDDYQSDESESSKQSSDEQNLNEEGSPLISEYERMRNERIKRNQARLAHLGLVGNDIIPKKQKTTRKPRKKMSLDLLPTRELPSRAGRATFMESSYRKERKENSTKEEEKNADWCFTCQTEGGELMCCDYCRTLYHPKCHPESTSEDVEGFRCHQCEAAGKKRRVACGFCDACKRPNDCETCVVCVNNRGDGKIKAKCIFRKCQSWGKGILEKDDKADDEEERDNHESWCDHCKEGGDLICCDACVKAFHSNCHKPKIYSIPDGYWTCMYCTVKPVREKKQHYKPRYGEPLIADMGDKELAIIVNWPVLNCNVCEGKETTGQFQNLEWVTCCACSDSYHMKCLNPPLEKRPHKWKCTTCKEKKRMAKENRLKEKTYAKPKNSKLFEGVHDDDCFMCFNGGDLLCCDYCSKVFHMQCHIPPLYEIPKGNWKCQECAAVEYKRMMRCGECNACLRDDCGKCNMCKDKPKFGGPGRLKQVCEKKRCQHMRLAPPASRKSMTNKNIKQQFKYAQLASKNDMPLTEKSPKKRKVSSSAYDQDHNYSQKKKKHKRQKMSLGATDNPVEKPQLTPGKIINSLDMVDTSLANDPVGSKIRTLISTAIKQVDKPSVVKHSCQYLRVFITSDRSVDIIFKLGGLLLLAKMMYEYVDETSVQVEAIRTLTKMAVKKQKCGDEIFGSGCFALTIESMASHPDVLELQQAACALLRALSYDFKNHNFIINAKGMEVMSAALKQNSNRLDSLLDGCYFLQNILCRSKEASSEFLSLGLTFVIAEGIDRFSSVPAYLRVACSVLTNVAIMNVSRNGAEVDKLCIKRVLSILEVDVDATTKEFALVTLKALSVGKEKFKSDFSQFNGIKSILDLIKSQPENVASVMYGLQLIVCVFSNKQDAETFVDADGFSIMMDQMKRHRNLVFIQTSGCSIMRRLDVSNLEVDIARDAVHLIFSTLNHFDGDSIQFDGRHALLNLVSQHPSIGRLLKKNSIRQINAKYMTQNDSDDASDVADTEVESSRAYEHVPKDYTLDAKNDQICQKVKGIISKASNHLSDNKIQDKACEQLRKIIDGKESAEKIIHLGGLSMIAEAMKAHNDKAVVQAEACATLTELLWKYPESSKNIVDAGCLSLVVQALKTHRNNSKTKLQQMGCGVFRTMSYENELHYFINRVNGFEAVLDSISHSPNKVAVLKEASLFIQNMLSNSPYPPEYTSLIISKDIIPIVIDGMKNTRDADTLEGLCGTIKNLALNAETRSVIGKHQNSIDTIIKVMTSDIDISVSKNALDALKMLCEDEEIRAQINVDDNFETIIAFAIENNDDIDVVETSFGLLLEFDTEIATNEEGIFKFVTSGMEKHADNQLVQYSGCRILSNLSFKTEAEAKVVIKLIVLTSMGKHLSDDEVQTSGICALLNICSEFPQIAASLRDKRMLEIMSKSELRGD